MGPNHLLILDEGDGLQFSNKAPLRQWKTSQRSCSSFLATDSLGVGESRELGEDACSARRHKDRASLRLCVINIYFHICSACPLSLFPLPPNPTHKEREAGA